MATLLVLYHWSSYYSALSQRWRRKGSEMCCWLRVGNTINNLRNPTCLCTTSDSVGCAPGAAHQYFFPRTENYYHRMKPDAVVEIVMDPSEEIGNTMVEHSSMTTSIQSQAEYRASCIKEPGCRWECEPRADDLPPDCDCVCFYTDAKWDNIP
ncbi:tRNA/tmRNA (uracil-C(5))-methyltransferase [Orchesella cincta]|uniref:tRNA/tmRNA (Uracil-C(5))-methyltransferase n=1 Tax=Orchesella cincta TaxID=48709 RepID=A0A1D2N122_ORCCI|nr:tRNA/tmRNA (uracil-C(5))-methyltransferase [Orchesella cincta]